MAKGSIRRRKKEMKKAQRREAARVSAVAAAPVIAAARQAAPESVPESVIAQAAPQAQNHAAPQAYDSLYDMSLNDLKVQLAEIAVSTPEQLDEAIQQTLAVEANDPPGTPSLVPFLILHEDIRDSLNRAEGNVVSRIGEQENPLDVVMAQGLATDKFNWAEIAAQAIRSNHMQSVRNLQMIAAQPEWDGPRFAKVIEQYRIASQDPVALQQLQDIAYDESMIAADGTNDFADFVDYLPVINQAWQAVEQNVTQSASGMESADRLLAQLHQANKDNTFNWRDITNSAIIFEMESSLSPEELAAAKAEFNKRQNEKALEEDAASVRAGGMDYTVIGNTAYLHPFGTEVVLEDGDLEETIEEEALDDVAEDLSEEYAEEEAVETGLIKRAADEAAEEQGEYDLMVLPKAETPAVIAKEEAPVRPYARKTFTPVFRINGVHTPEQQQQAEPVMQLVKTAKDELRTIYDEAPLGLLPAHDAAIDSRSEKSVSDIVGDLMQFGEILPEMKQKPDGQTSRATLKAQRQYVKQLMIDMNHPDVRVNQKYRQKGEYSALDAHKVPPKKLHKFYKDMVAAIDNCDDYSKHLALSGRTVLTDAKPQPQTEQHAAQEEQFTPYVEVETRLGKPKQSFFQRIMPKKLRHVAAIAGIVAAGSLGGAALNGVAPKAETKDNNAGKEKAPTHITYQAPQAATQATAASESTAFYAAPTVEQAPDVVETVKVETVKETPKPAHAATVKVKKKASVAKRATAETVSRRELLPVEPIRLAATEISMPKIDVSLPKIEIVAPPAIKLADIKVNSESITENQERKKPFLKRVLHGLFKSNRASVTEQEDMLPADSLQHNVQAPTLGL